MRRLAAILILAASPLAAEEEDAAPTLGMLEGSVLTHSLSRSFDEYAMPVGPFTRDEQPVETLEGRVNEFVFELNDETSTLEAIRNYEARLEELGFEQVYQCDDKTCGGFDFRFNTYIVDPPAMRFDLADFRFLAASRAEDASHAAVLTSRQGEKLFIQVVEVSGEAAPITMTPPEEAPQPQAKPGTARLFALARRLTEVGHAPLEGIAFQAGSAELTEDSAPALEQAAQILKGRPDLKFLVVGHSDNQGDLELNLKLSKERAASVAAALAAIDGVGEDQLTAHGVGFLSPRATNASDEGRAQNRRVELVLQ
ncbi:MAG: OmpA family protein [Pseudomonadota bacterium]